MRYLFREGIMKNRIKFIFTRLTLLSIPISLAVSTIYLKVDYSFNKSFQLGTLIAMATVLALGLLFTVIYILIYPILARQDRKAYEARYTKKKKRKKNIQSQFMPTKTETKDINKTSSDTESQVAQQETTETKQTVNQIDTQPETPMDIPQETQIKMPISSERAKIDTAKEIKENQKREQKREQENIPQEPAKPSEDIMNLNKTLEEMAQTQGEYSEIMLVLAEDLSFLLAKEAINNFSFSKIVEEDSETGIIMGKVGFGSSPQEIKLTVKSTTGHSTILEVVSKSNTKKQSKKKNLSYIEKISTFLRKKEKEYS